MATIRRAAHAPCPVDMDALRAALEAGEAARAAAVLGTCRAPAGTACYSHKVARMTVYRYPEVSAALGRLPLWPVSSHGMPPCSRRR